MKITEIKTFVVGNPWKNWVFLKVYTDEGITGLGEATGGLKTKPQLADLEELSRFVIGKNPLNPEFLFHKMLKGRFLSPSTGMCGIEIACWDIVGKHLGVPLWQLLGGKYRDRLRVYANGWYRGPREPAFFAERASMMVEKGYTALKFDPFGGAYLHLDNPGLRLSINIVRAVRDAVGPDVDVLVEGHDRFCAATAVRIAGHLAEFDPMFFETPVNSLDIAATVEVARASQVSIASGERFDRLDQFIRILESKKISIVQPEAMHLGISGTKKACAIAEAHDALVACHQAQSPFCTAVNTAIHASIPNFLIQENFDDGAEAWTWDLLQGVPRVEDGYISTSDEPGLGVQLNEAEVEKHPYGPTNFLRLFEEGWETRKPG